MAPSDEAAVIARISQPPSPGQPYGVPVPGSETPNRSAVYRHFRFRDTPLMESLDPSIRTLHDTFESVSAHKRSYPCLGWRPWNATTRQWEPKYVWMTYGEVAERRKNLGAGLVELHKQAGVTADKYGIGLWCQNRPEWQITDLAAISQSLWAVSLYETLGPDATEHIINHSELVCVVASLPHIPALLKLAPRVPTLKLIVSIEPLDAGEPSGCSKAALLQELAAERGVRVLSMAEVETIGARSGRAMRPPRPEDITTINYTSGTTGVPKGVVLTHANMVAAISSARASGFLTNNDTHISYLPLAHIYGRMADWTTIWQGGRVGYFHGDMTELVDDLKILQPTGLFSVPRLYNRFYTGIRAATVEAPGFKGSLSRTAVAAKTARMHVAPPARGSNWHPLYDRIWTPKVRRAVGLDRVVSAVSGSAQLDPDVQSFLRAAFGIQFLQGYGMTETCAVGCVQQRDDFSVGNIGAPQPCAEFCIESVPDLEYTVQDKPHPRGELLIRGPIVFREYYKNAEETARSVDSAADGGWFHSGDIVEVDAMGRFSIIDRKKNVLKLAQGEYVSPERIENVYIAASPLVAAAYVHGDPIEACLVAVVAIEPEHFAPFAAALLQRDVAAGDVAALREAAHDPRVKAAVLKQLDKIGRKHKFNSFERVGNCYLDVDPFTVENELLTPTLKLKRPQTAKAFRKQIDEMYAEIKAQTATKARL